MKQTKVKDIAPNLGRINVNDLITILWMLEAHFGSSEVRAAIRRVLKVLSK